MIEEDDVANEDGGKTIQEVFDTLTDEQKEMVYFLIGKVAKLLKGD